MVVILQLGNELETSSLLLSAVHRQRETCKSLVSFHFFKFDVANSVEYFFGNGTSVAPTQADQSQHDIEF